ncbi:MAG: hypothetical protein KBD63_04150 [Bacteriovoracaceae bacterium]|nr:hypothetical protein [Bacteriovoracaceae bacterium]
MKAILFLILLLPFSVKTEDLLEQVLQNDFLKEDIFSQKRQQQEIKKVSEKDQYNFPSQSDFFNFMSEYWLVKKIEELKWDKMGVEYGVQDVIRNLFVSLNLPTPHYRMLLVHSSQFYHGMLPSLDTPIFIISEPFLRAINLSKLEIALLFLENYYRLQANYFIKKVETTNLKMMLTTNFYPQSVDSKLIKKTLNAYDTIFFKKGFSLRQQYEVTKKMAQVLSSKSEILDVYYVMLGKVESLTKNNLYYKNYNKIYPFASVQQRWLLGKK